MVVGVGLYVRRHLRVGRDLRDRVTTCSAAGGCKSNIPFLPRGARETTQLVVPVAGPDGEQT